MHKVGDVVKLRPGSDARDLLGDLAGVPGRVAAVLHDDDGERVNVTFGKDGPVAFGLPAVEFVAAT